ncbi:MAG: outer membrane protein [Candidatus Eisenbacteria bacterium]
MSTRFQLRPRVLNHIGVGALACASLVLCTSSARATEIVPSLGMTRAVDNGNQTQLSGGLAVRGHILPLLEAEIAAGYRSDSRFDGALHVRQWPITTSLWLTPIPEIYAGGGVGFYQTTMDYDQSRVPLVHDETRQDFGIHLGGGVQVPLAPSVGLDVGGRYVMMRDQESPLIPQRFNPDFWTLNAGLAFKF